MIQRSISGDPVWPSVANAQFSTEQLGCSNGYDLGADVRTLLQNREASIDVLDVDAMSDEDQGIRVGVDPGISADVV